MLLNPYSCWLHDIIITWRWLVIVIRRWWKWLRMIRITWLFCWKNMFNFCLMFRFLMFYFAYQKFQPYGTIRYENQQSNRKSKQNITTFSWKLNFNIFFRLELLVVKYSVPNGFARIPCFFNLFSQRSFLHFRFFAETEKHLFLITSRDKALFGHEKSLILQQLIYI